MEEFSVFAKNLREEHKKMQERHLKEWNEHPHYHANHIFDEDKSVRWNREEVTRRNNKRQELLRIQQEEEDTIFQKAEDRILEEIKDVYGFSDALCRVIYKKAYEDGHSNGTEEIYTYAMDYASFADDILDASK